MRLAIFGILLSLSIHAADGPRTIVDLGIPGQAGPALARIASYADGTIEVRYDGLIFTNFPRGTEERYPAAQASGLRIVESTVEVSSGDGPVGHTVLPIIERRRLSFLPATEGGGIVLTDTQNADSPLTVQVLQVEDAQVTSVPYVRFWRGARLDSVPVTDFPGALGQSFLGQTIEVGGGRGLIGYLPALPPRYPGLDLPDEIALVVYRNQTQYAAIRATAEGKAYGDLHWQYFDKASSGSLVPGPLPTGDVVLEKAYDLVGRTIDWQAHPVVFSAFRRSTWEDRTYYAALSTYFRAAPVGVAGRLVLPSNEYVLEYTAFETEAAAQHFFASKGKSFGDLPRGLVRAHATLLEKQPGRTVKWDYGKGVNFSFRCLDLLVDFAG